MADPVGLSMGALPLHWQPGEFHFKGGGAPSTQLSHIIPTVFAVFISGAMSKSNRFNDVYVWGTSQELTSLSLVETLSFCDCRPSSSIKSALNAFHPLACSTFIFPHEQHVGTLKTVQVLFFANTASEKKTFCQAVCCIWYREPEHIMLQLKVSCFVFLWMLASWKSRKKGTVRRLSVSSWLNLV